MFDRLLLISVGQTLYFGDIGSQGALVSAYFGKHGARTKAADSNFAEWMMQVTAEDPSDQSWAEKWKGSAEYAKLQDELAGMQNFPGSLHAASTAEYATSQLHQFTTLTYRTFQEAWRTPSYIWGRTLFYTCVVSLSACPLIRLYANMHNGLF